MICLMIPVYIDQHQRSSLVTLTERVRVIERAFSPLWLLTLGGEAVTVFVPENNLQPTIKHVGKMNFDLKRSVPLLLVCLCVFVCASCASSVLAGVCEPEQSVPGLSNRQSLI